MLRVCAPKHSNASFPPRKTATAAATAAATTLQLLLKVFVVARVIFKRRNPGAAENGAKGVLGLLNIAMKDLATHACPHACP